MRRSLARTAAVAAAVLATGTLLAAPTATASATATSTFDVTYGNTYTRGTITWYNRSVRVAGEHKSVDAGSCRGTTAFLLDSGSADVGHASSPEIVCGASGDFGFPVSTDRAGVNVVRICLEDGAPEPTYYKCVRYSRP
ncbi:hypothetical protein [Streptomyces sp. NPDC090025]|uniref:hypothetical protein n=1 Tax=Streptomyces sp. NPDC090025 TaxID=3365922 RepID=UPI00383722D0